MLILVYKIKNVLKVLSGCAELGRKTLASANQDQPLTRSLGWKETYYNFKCARLSRTSLRPSPSLGKDFNEMIPYNQFLIKSD